MDAAIGKFCDSVGSFFSGGDNLPWCDRDIIAGCEKEVAEAVNEEQKAESLMRNGDYARSRQLLERCLEIAPDWRQALTLQKVVEDKIARDGLIGMGITATAFGVVGLLVGGIVAAASRKK
ncbi:Mitochondrial fission 1 protein A [Ananas comosus]|uniref:Mitochondrial fission 1 protein A n=1 Tax=Ananas comosus TaxID=4615 RepID=A0A199VLX3_ANACO|nr:Mitochondrial fission 1 protein A [Ananas comosus]